MKQVKIRACALIAVRFPPPPPPDLGRGLRQEVKVMLGPAGDCTALNTGALDPSTPGWMLEIRLKRVTHTAEWVERLSDLLRARGAAPETRLEVRRHRGPIEVRLPDATPYLAAVSLLVPRAGDAARGTLLVELPPRLPDFAEVRDALASAAAPDGVVTASYEGSLHSSVDVAVSDAARLPSVTSSLCGILSTRPWASDARLYVSAVTEPLVIPLYATD